MARRYNKGAPNIPTRILFNTALATMSNHAKKAQSSKIHIRDKTSGQEEIYEIVFLQKC